MDYKYNIQMAAEYLAAEEHDGAWYYDLPEAVRDDIYRRAEASYWERRCE